MIYNSFDNVGFVRVLSFLKSHNSEYVSGQDLSDVLKISRVAVWKHIKKIQELGYTVESKQKLGYKLISNSDLLLPWEITSNLKTKIVGQQAYYFDSIDSTQNQALKMAENPENNGTVIVAAKQTGGRMSSSMEIGGERLFCILGIYHFPHKLPRRPSMSQVTHARQAGRPLFFFWRVALLIVHVPVRTGRNRM